MFICPFLHSLMCNFLTQTVELARCIKNNLASYTSHSPGCMMAIALGRENIANQNKLAEADAFQQLARLLRSPKTSDRVLLVVIKVIGTLCVGQY